MTGNLASWFSVLWKLGVAGLFLAGLVWGVFAWGARRDRSQDENGLEEGEVLEMPAIDAAVTENYETATFALG